jgi:hypothetical protein
VNLEGKIKKKNCLLMAFNLKCVIISEGGSGGRLGKTAS